MKFNTIASIVLNILLAALFALAIFMTTGLASLAIGFVVAMFLFVAVSLFTDAAPDNALCITLCGKIASNILIDCNNPLIAGTNDELIIMNKVDIASVTRNGVNPQIIEGITMVSGATAFQYEGKNNSVEPSYELRKLRYAEVYGHNVNFKVFTNSAAIKKELEALAKGDTVAIIKNNHEGIGGASAYEIYGIDSGLNVTEMVRNPTESETQGAHNVLLATPEESSEAHMPSTLFLTNLATTKAIVDGLL